MTDGKKQFFVTDKLVAFLFLNLIPKKVRPNHITICRFVLTPIVIFLFLRHHYFWGGLTFLIAALTDLLDGMVARQRRQITNLGKILDPLADKLLILSVF